MASNSCQVATCAAAASAAYAVEFEGPRPTRYVSLCGDHNEELLRRHRVAEPAAVLAFVSAATSASAVAALPTR